MVTAEKIILAALNQFQTHGFIAATTKAIAAGAGVAEVTLFRCFGDKKTLFEKVADHIAEKFGLMEIPAVKTGDFRKDAGFLCRSLLRHFIRYNSLFRMLIFEARNNEDIRLVLRNVRRRSLQNMQSLVNHYADSGGGHTMERMEWLANSLMGASLCYCLFHSTEDEETYIQTQAGLIANAFVDTIKTAGE